MIHVFIYPLNPPKLSNKTAAALPAFGNAAPLIWIKAKDRPRGKRGKRGFRSLVPKPAHRTTRSLEATLRIERPPRSGEERRTQGQTKHVSLSLAGPWTRVRKITCPKLHSRNPLVRNVAGIPSPIPSPSLPPKAEPPTPFPSGRIRYLLETCARQSSPPAVRGKRALGRRWR